MATQKRKSASPPTSSAGPVAIPLADTRLHPTEDGAEPAPLQVDTEEASAGDNDADSTYSSKAGSNYTGSVASSIYNYQYENGRRYHAYREGKYVLPNDDSEQERLELHHHIWRLLIGGRLFTASVPDEQSNPALRVLDLGTGTGAWAMDLADEMPNSQVFGVDLSPIQPAFVPPNCHFHIDDYELDWTYSDEEKFDFIHGRAVGGTVADWPAFYRNVMNNLKPGGILEMQEYDAWIYSDDDSMQRAPWTQEWLEKLDQAAIKFGKRFSVAHKQRQWLIDAGFEDVKERTYRIPIGSWAKDPALKELGKFERVQMQMAVDSHTSALFTRVWNYTPEQVSVLCEGVKREFRDKNLRLITAYRFITGRKPRQ